MAINVLIFVELKVGVKFNLPKTINQKKSGLSVRFQVKHQFLVIGNYLIVEVGIKKLLGEMMRIAH